MRKIYILIVIILLVVGFNWLVIQNEHLLANGKKVLLSLAPVDPRALLLGDYMALDFAINREVTLALRKKYIDDCDPPSFVWRNRRAYDLLYYCWPDSGLAVIRISKEVSKAGIPANTATFVGLDEGKPLQEGEGYIFYRVREGRAFVAAKAFYFQEGHAKAYEQARYGLLRLDENGKNLLVNLCDGEGKVISP